MIKFLFSRPIALCLLLCSASISLTAQNKGSIPYKSLEVSEIDGIPVLIKHLPDWESVRDKTTFAGSEDQLRTALGANPVVDQIDFTAGTEAVTAPYPAGRLLIVEYPSPQGSIEADARFIELFARGLLKNAAYKRIGNYNVFVFEAADPTAANALVDQVKYEKQIQWLGKNPFRISAERAFVLTTSDIFLSTLFVILIGMGIAIVGGVIVGYFFFYYRDGKRSKTHVYTDAGGMTRLNLDGFTPDVIPDRLLGD